MKMIKFPSIDQFKAVVKAVSERAQWVGRDESGNPVFNRNAMLPKLNFKGTVKLHGTNASICYNHIDGLWCQSRERIITPTDDNAGFAFWVESNKEAIMALIREYALNNELTLTDNTICIYGEWCGGSIQKGVALNQLEKMFVVFGVKLANEDDSANLWMDSNSIKNEDIRCFNIGQFPSFEIEIDFNNPALVQNKLIEMTLAVEEECPVGKYFGVSGIGEGIVFTHMFDDGSVVRFKSKGTKHSNSKVRTLKVVDDAVEQAKIELANAVCPDWRIDQAVQEIFDTLNGGEPDVKRLGDVIKWVTSDIMKEELHKFAEAKIEPKQVMSKVGPIVKQRFFEVHYVL